MPRKKQNLALATVESTAAKFIAPPFEVTKSEAEFLAVETITRKMLEQDWREDEDLSGVSQAYQLTAKQAAQCVREAQRNVRRSIVRPQAAHQLVVSTLAWAIDQCREQNDVRGATDAAYKLSQATGTQANIKLKIIEQQQRMDLMRTKLLTGQASAEEVAATIVADLMGGNGD